MILLFALFILLSDAHFINYRRVHLAEVLKLKCEALPYPTTFVDTYCYFVVMKLVFKNETSAECSRIVQGGKVQNNYYSVTVEVATNVPADIFSTMMVDKSLFHTGSDSAAKHTICVVDSGYDCEAKGQRSSVMTGKCVAMSDKKMTYSDAERHCNRLGMEIPPIDNDEELIRGALSNDPVWVGVSYQNNVWQRQKAFTRFGTCESDYKDFKSAALSPSQCSGSSIGSIIDKTGYWTLVDLSEGRYQVVFSRDAENEFTGDLTPKPRSNYEHVKESNVSCYYEPRSRSRLSTNGLCALKGFDPCKAEGLVSVFGNCAGLKVLTVVNDRKCISGLSYKDSLCVPWETMYVDKVIPTAQGNFSYLKTCTTGLADAIGCAPNSHGSTMLTGQYTDQILAFASTGNGLIISSCWTYNPSLQQSYCPTHPRYGKHGWTSQVSGLLLRMGVKPCGKHSVLISGSGGSRCIGYEVGSIAPQFSRALTTGTNWNLWNGSMEEDAMDPLLKYEEYMALPRVLITPF